MVAIRRELRALTQEITPLVGFLGDISESRTLSQWALFFDDLHSIAERVESHALMLKHEADIAWERNYALGREDDGDLDLP